MISKLQIVELLNDLERFSDASKEQAGTQRKKIWDQILVGLAKSSSDLSAELAAALDVSQITVERWMRGEYAPRPSLLEKLRQHFGAAGPREQVAAGLNPERPVLFAGSFAALRTIDHFFHRLQFATCCFVFKGMMEYHAGRQSTTLKRVIETLKGNRDLTIYYVFPKDSPADMTFARLQESLDPDFPETEPEVKKRIKRVEISAEEDEMGLKYSLASPFLVRYSEAGRKKFNRSVDIWYEVPVEPLDPNGEVNDVMPLFVFVQLPSSDSKELWAQWRKALEPFESKSITEGHLN